MPSAPHADSADLDVARRLALRASSTLVLGAYRVWMGRRLQVGRSVLANHRLIMKGPGRIEIADDANLFAFGVGRRTRLVARTPHAVIAIGTNARLNGCELHAASRIEIGPDCIIGQAVLLDTDMHSLDKDRRRDRDAPVRTAPIVLESRVWVARGAAILPGVTIGEGSVVAFGSVVTADVPPGVVVAGNPARVVRSLD
jgi:carbonic anhydrase/acetyltransferase-like protein (isoleucine patch superfamily)